MNLSKNFTLDELTFSETASRLAIANVPDSEVMFNLERLCEELLEPVRVLLGRPMIITSGYRSEALNKAIGGSKTSEHRFGRAVDFRVPHMTPYEVCRKIEPHIEELRINQLIHEFGSWTHMSIAELAKKPKAELLTARNMGGDTVWIQGIVAV